MADVIRFAQLIERNLTSEVNDAESSELRQRKKFDIENGNSVMKTHREIQNKNYIKKVMLESGKIDSNIDPFTFDITEEAKEKVRFKLFDYVEDLFVNVCFPFSILYIYPRYGYLGLQIRGMAPPDSAASDSDSATEGYNKEDKNATENAAYNANDDDDDDDDDECVNTIFEDREKPAYNLKAIQFFAFTIVVNVLKYSYIVLYWASGSKSSSSSPATMYLFYFALLTFTLMNLSLSNKKAYRKQSSLERLLLHKERRLEELLFGWLPMPWQLAVFEFRLAAYNIGQLDLVEQKFTFPSCTEEQLRQAIGEKVLSYIENNGNGKRATSIGKSVLFNDKPVAQCTALTIMLRIALENSFATPAFGDDAPGLYMDYNGSPWWFYYVLFLIAIPFVVAHIIQDGGTYTGIEIASCIISILVILATSVAPPQGFTLSAILTIARRRKMLSFMNNLLLSDDNQTHFYDDNDDFHLTQSNEDEDEDDQTWGSNPGVKATSILTSIGKVDSEYSTVNTEMKIAAASTPKPTAATTPAPTPTPTSTPTSTHQKPKWNLTIDMSNTSNINLWKRCRDLIMEYGTSYRCRSDANGALMIIYVIVFTLILVLISILVPGKISFSHFAYPIMLHLLLIIPMSLFALALAFEGERCNVASDQSAAILASSMIHFEEKISKRNKLLSQLEFQAVTSARNAASQLQISLEMTKSLHPTEILNLITLDRALVMTILFAVFTQFTLILDALKLR
jgi:hypothetical protein